MSFERLEILDPTLFEHVNNQQLNKMGERNGAASRGFSFVDNFMDITSKSMSETNDLRSSDPTDR